ncbi:MAG: ATP-binding protein [Nitrospirota bacterium]
MNSLFINIQPIYLIYFFYGAAFLIMAASIAAKDMKGSELMLAKSLRLLGLFGLSHGFHEWMQLYPLIEGDHLSLRAIYISKLAALIVFIVSYLFLLWFGLTLINGVSEKRVWRIARTVPVLLAVVWVLHVWYTGFTMDMQFLRQASIATRHTFGLFGSLLTAYGLTAYSREVGYLSRTAARNLAYAGASFGFYGFVAGVVSSGFTLFRFPIPVEVLRGAAGILITYFIIKALNIFDVEMRKKIELQTRRIVQAEKLTSLGQLAAGIAHEINNPLANASLGIQTLKRRISGDRMDGSVLDKLELVERNIDRAAGIARELLQFSRQQEVDVMPVHVNAVLRGTLTLLEYKLKGVSVRQDLHPVPSVMGDAGKLEQVFINVLSNAVEAMPQGGSMSIATSVEGSFVQVRVDDSGSGIPEELLSRVFDPFFTTKDVGAGTGLGLAICYGIVKQHHGTIELRSTAGKGTTVIIRLPRREDDEKDIDRG